MKFFSKLDAYMLCFATMSPPSIFTLLLCAFWLHKIIDAEDILVTTSDIFTCGSTSSECRFFVDESCDNSCKDSEYHCPSNPTSCVKCELYCNGGDKSCSESILFSYYCDQVNVVSNSSSEQVMKGINIK